MLLDREARSTPSLTNPNVGRVREPVLRLANWMRAFKATSVAGSFLLGTTDDPSNSLGQSPLRAPSVFNYYRPGYVPPNTGIAAAGLVAPEMQIVNETSVIGYSNYLRNAVQNGVGTNRDIQPNYDTEMSLAHRPDQLVAHLDTLLIWAFAGRRGMMGVWPAILVTGASFAVVQFAVSNFMGPELVDVLASLVSMGCLLGFLRFWQPKVIWRAAAMGGSGTEAAASSVHTVRHHRTREVIRAALPWIIQIGRAHV